MRPWHLCVCGTSYGWIDGFKDIVTFIVTLIGLSNHGSVVIWVDSCGKRVLRNTWTGMYNTLETYVYQKQIDNASWEAH